jgi:hypothetical protein
MKQNKSVSEDILVFERRVWTDSRNRETLVIPRKVAIYLGVKSEDVLLYKMEGSELTLVRPGDVESDGGYNKISLFKTNGDAGVYPVGVYYPEESISTWNLKEGEKVIVTFSFIDTAIRVLPKWIYTAREKYVSSSEGTEELIRLGKIIRKFGYVPSGYTTDVEGIFIPFH